MLWYQVFSRLHELMAILPILYEGVCQLAFSRGMANKLTHLPFQKCPNPSPIKRAIIASFAGPVKQRESRKKAALSVPFRVGISQTWRFTVFRRKRGQVPGTLTGSSRPYCPLLCLEGKGRENWGHWLGGRLRKNVWGGNSNETTLLIEEKQTKELQNQNYEHWQVTDQTNRVKSQHWTDGLLKQDFKPVKSDSLGLQASRFKSN